MHITLLQLNYTVGDLDGNADKIIQAVKPLSGKAKLCVTSELALLGYPPKDLLLYDNFIQAIENKLDYLAKALKNSPALLVGCVVKNRTGIGKPLYNAAAFIAEGHVKQYFYKSLIPSYDVFDEDRYFESSNEVNLLEFNGMKLGVTICEDIWNHEISMQTPRYAKNPVAALASKGVDAIINLSASPFCMHKHEDMREPLLFSWTQKYAIPFIYVNQVGGNDELIFDGNSCYIDKNGTCVARAKAFAEDALIVDINTTKDEVNPKLNPTLSVEEELYKALVCGTRDYAKKCGFKTAILGLSGGIDSALTLAIAVEALGKENVFAVLMPSPFSSQGSIDDAMLLVRNLNVSTYTLPIDDLMQNFETKLEGVFVGRAKDTTEENLQARIRGNLLMAMSNKFNHLLLTTGNKSELAVGYCTVYGDMCGGLAVISDVYKTMVYRLANWINASCGKEIIPINIITKAPSAELRHNQLDEDNLPPYDLLDAILYAYVECHQSVEEMVQQGFAREVVLHIINLVTKAEFKRQQAAPGLKVTERAFGVGWRMPVAAIL